MSDAEIAAIADAHDEPFPDEPFPDEQERAAPGTPPLDV